MDSARPERFELPSSGFVALCIYRLFQFNKLDAPPSPNFTPRPADSRRALIPHALVLRDVHRWAELDLAALVAACRKESCLAYPGLLPPLECWLRAGDPPVGSRCPIGRAMPTQLGVLR